MLGVDTFFDIHYNVGRNGEKWGAHPKNRRLSNWEWEKSERLFYFWVIGFLDIPAPGRPNQRSRRRLDHDRDHDRIVSIKPFRQTVQQAISGHQRVSGRILPQSR